MEKVNYDFVIIGSGPSGQQAAEQAAKLGKKVAVVERGPGPGGNCLYNGTIPSKTLRQAILDLTRFHERSFYGDKEEIKKVNIDDLNHRLSQVIEEEKRVVSAHLQKQNIDYIEANAEFTDPHTLQLIGLNGKKTELTSSIFLIASGSRPRHPHEVSFDDDVILDSNKLLKIKRVPETMLILGGGVIGCEYGSFFALLGTKVTIVDRRDTILPMLDKEIGSILHRGLERLGLCFSGNITVDKIWRENNKAYISTKSGDKMSADTLLFALGRTANVQELNIENAEVQKDEKGYICVNDHFQTSAQHIYAVGDVIGGPCLASTSMEQGRLAARHACKVKSHPFPEFYPYGIYTIPSISTYGYTEEQLKEKGYHYEIGRADFNDIARSHINGSSHGMFKILFHKETQEILGVHIIGDNATELIHIGQIVQGIHGKLHFFADHIFNYPTFAEGYRIAALDGLSKISCSKKENKCG